MARPIFYDPSGRRKRWSLLGVALLVLTVIAVAAVFATIVAVPVGPPLPIRYERGQPLPLKAQVAGAARRLRSGLRWIGWLPRLAHVAPGTPLTVGFYVPWDESSRASLQHHVGALDWVIPAQMSVVGEWELGLGGRGEAACFAKSTRGAADRDRRAARARTCGGGRLRFRGPAPAGARRLPPAGPRGERAVRGGASPGRGHGAGRRPRLEPRRLRPRGRPRVPDEL